MHYSKSLFNYNHWFINTCWYIDYKCQYDRINLELDMNYANELQMVIILYYNSLQKATNMISVNLKCDMCKAKWITKGDFSLQLSTNGNMQKVHKFLANNINWEGKKEHSNNQ